jgi:hypothetical protein
MGSRTAPVQELTEVLVIPHGVPAIRRFFFAHLRIGPGQIFSAGSQVAATQAQIKSGRATAGPDPRPGFLMV